jgi:hypothetical protein
MIALAVLISTCALFSLATETRLSFFEIQFGKREGKIGGAGIQKEIGAAV